MQITCNGKTTTVEDNATLERLLQTLDLDGDTVVVEINQTIIDRDQYATTRLAEGDRVELVRFVGGG